jgi:hypothetical protein
VPAYIAGGITIAGTTPTEAQAPDFTTNLSTTPVSYSISDTAAALSVLASVTDSGTITYQWYSNTENSTTGGTALTDATAASFTPPATTAGTTYYYVIATNTLGESMAAEASNVATIQVLPKTDTDQATTLTFRIGPKTANATFYVTTGYDADGYDMYDTSSPLAATDGGGESGYHVYTVQVPVTATAISYRGTDANGHALGGMSVDVDDAVSGVITLCQVEGYIGTKINNAYTTDEQALITVRDADYRNATCGSTYVDSYGVMRFRYLLFAGGNSELYTFYAVPQGELAQTYETGVMANYTIDAQTSVHTVFPPLALPLLYQYSITAPTEAVVQVFRQLRNFYDEGIDASRSTDNGDGTATHIFNLPGGNSTLTYRVSMNGKMTKAGYLPALSANGGITVAWDGNDPAPGTRTNSVSSSTLAERLEESVCLNVNAQNNLKLNTGDTFRLRAYRAWEIINGDTSNIMIEPDFHCKILSGSDVVSISPVRDINGNATGNWLDVTALKPGTAIVEITYDAISIGGNTEFTGIYAASDPIRSGLVVIQVAQNGSEKIDLGMSRTCSGQYNNNGIQSSVSNTTNWDAEFDTVYFTGAAGTFSFAPTVAGGTITGVEVLNNPASNGAWLPLTPSSGVYTAPILPGNNIIRITAGDTIEYQIVRGATVAPAITNVTAPGQPLLPGDQISISFGGLYMPIWKMSGIYNPGYLFGECTVYGALPKGMTLESTVLRNQWTLPTKNGLTVSADSAGTYTLGEGFVYFSIMSGSDSLGDHRLLTDTGIGANFSAVETYHAHAILPDVTLDVAAPMDTVTFNITPSDATVTVKDNLNATISPISGSTFSLKVGATYSYSVSAENCVTQTGTFTVLNGGQTITVDITQTAVTVSFSVTPSNASVTVTDSSNTTIAPSSGTSYTLREGAVYRYTVSADNYETQTGSFTVPSGGRTLTVTLIRATDTVTFAVTPSGASVTVIYGNNVTIAPTSGTTYTLSVGETYTYSVSAAGYATKTGSFTVASGGQTITVALCVQNSGGQTELPDFGPVVGRVHIIVENQTFTTAASDGSLPAWSGKLIDGWYDLCENDSMMTAALKALMLKGCHWSTGSQGIPSGWDDYSIIYLASVIVPEGVSADGSDFRYDTSMDGNLAEFSGESGSGWMGTLNDWFVNAGLHTFGYPNGKLQNGDEIHIMYTQNKGDDLGGSWGNSDTSLKALACSAGTLTPAFSSATLTYGLIISGSSQSLTLTPTASNKNYLVKTFLNTYKSDAAFYRRTAALTVRPGDTVYVGCGDPSWPSMNNQGDEARPYTGTTYTIKVFGSMNDYLKDSKGVLGATTKLTPAVTAEGGVASVMLGADDMAGAIADAKDNGSDTIVIAPEITGTVKKVTVELPKASLNAIASDTDADLTVETPVGNMTIPNDVLASIASQAAGGTVTMSLEAVNTSSLTTAQQKAVGDRPVYDISIFSGNTRISSFGSGSITVSLPYTLKNGETGENVTVWYLDDSGKLRQMTCTYDKETGLATFTTDHLSYYLVGYDAWTNPFGDVKSTDWFYNAVRYVSQNTLMSGSSATAFEPKTDMTRAMLVTVLYRLEGKPAVTAKNSFSDVKNGEWYTEAVIWADANGIAGGYGGGLFGTEDSVTREQLAAILMNYAKYKGYDVTKTVDLSTYTDASKISGWALSAVKWANADGLLTGRTTTTIAPSVSGSRAEVAEILMRFVEKFVK